MKKYQLVVLLASIMLFPTLIFSQTVKEQAFRYLGSYEGCATVENMTTKQKFPITLSDKVKIELKVLRWYCISGIFVPVSARLPCAKDMKQGIKAFKVKEIPMKQLLKKGPKCQPVLHEFPPTK